MHLHIQMNHVPFVLLLIFQHKIIHVNILLVDSLSPTLDPNHCKTSSTNQRAISPHLGVIDPHGVRTNLAISRICRPFDTYSLLLVPRPQKSTTRPLDVTLHDMGWTYTVARQRRQGGGTLEEEHDHCDREWSRRRNTYTQIYWI